MAKNRATGNEIYILPISFSESQDSLPVSLENSLSQPLDLQVKKGGSTLGYLLQVTTQHPGGRGYKDSRHAGLPFPGGLLPRITLKERLLWTTHFSRTLTHSSFIFTATPMSQMKKLSQADHLKVTQEVQAGSETQPAPMLPFRSIDWIIHFLFTIL